MSTHQSTGTNKVVRFVLIGFAALVLIVAIAYRALMKPRQLSTYFARLEPGMSYSDVTQFMPRAMITADQRAATSVVWRTVLVRSNAVPASEVYCAGHGWSLSGIESGIIYFDEQDRLIGAYYSSSGGGGWAPQWGGK